MFLTFMFNEKNSLWFFPQNLGREKISFLSWVAKSQVSRTLTPHMFLTFMFNEKNTLWFFPQNLGMGENHIPTVYYRVLIVSAVFTGVAAIPAPNSVCPQSPVRTLPGPTSSTAEFSIPSSLITPARHASSSVQRTGCVR